MNNNTNNGQVNNPVMPNQPIQNGPVPQGMPTGQPNGQAMPQSNAQNTVAQPQQVVQPVPPMGQPIPQGIPQQAIPQSQPVQPVSQAPMVGQPVPGVNPQMMVQQPQVPVQPNMMPQQPMQVNPMPQGMPSPMPGPIPQGMPPMGQPGPVQTTIGPQVAAPVAPIKQEVPQAVSLDNEVKPEQALQSSVVEESVTKEDTDNITFDYNALYGVNQNNKVEEKVEEESRPIFTAQDIVIETNSLENRRVDDVVPEFNLNALDENVDENNTGKTDNIMTDKQKDRADTRRKIIYIGIIFLLITICLVFLFPIIAGYNH